MFFMNITFYGAAREVTGSCSLLQAAGQKILIDCGMFQGSDFNEGKNSDPLAFNSSELDAVLVTHAHLDHTGRLPILVQGGFAGNFYATPATVELTQLILEDAYSVMEYNNRKYGSPILYDLNDVDKVMEQFVPVEYGTPLVIELDPLLSSPLKGGVNAIFTPFKEGRGEVLVTFHDAGHIFGSAFIEIQAEGKRVVFSGDVGNVDVPILRDTALLPSSLDVLICESTYGDRLHESSTERLTLLETVITQAIKRGGTLMIPSFSLERTQELLFILNDLIDHQRRLPRVPIYLDSPLAINATKVYRKFTRYYDSEARDWLLAGDDLFQFPGLTETLSKEDSKKINATSGPKIIIAGAGMMNGGRIVHHALRYLSDVRNTILFIGYQAHNTLGRQIFDRQPVVNVMGERVAVKCQIQAIGAFSAHGDQNKLVNWINSGVTPPKKVFLNHGEPAASEALAKRLTKEFKIKTTIVDNNLTVKI